MEGQNFDSIARIQHYVVKTDPEEGTTATWLNSIKCIDLMARYSKLGAKIPKEFAEQEFFLEDQTSPFICPDVDSWIVHNDPFTFKTGVQLVTVVN